MLDRHGVLDGRIIENVSRIRQTLLLPAARGNGAGLLPIGTLG
jgi:hypothetical protein